MNRLMSGSNQSLNSLSNKLYSETDKAKAKQQAKEREDNIKKAIESSPMNKLRKQLESVDSYSLSDDQAVIKLALGGTIKNRLGFHNSNRFKFMSDSEKNQIRQREQELADKYTNQALEEERQIRERYQ